MQTISTKKTKNLSLKMRSPEKVMRLSRMGASFQTRLSFSRTLTRRISKEEWKFEPIIFDIDNDGYGISVLSVHTKDNTYSLVAFTNLIPPEERTDRVVADVWDSTFSLFDGIPNKIDLNRLALNTPRQEAGRFSPKELVLARANKSLRLFDHVVSRLSDGCQPDVDLLKSVGYLMRTTAVYGSGKFGCSDREKISMRPEFAGAFQVELLTVYLIRWFTIKLVEYVASCRGGENAVSLNPEIGKFLGIGNATGLGMAPFMIKHPILINNWVLAREKALLRIISIKFYKKEKYYLFKKLLVQSILHMNEWNVEDKKQNLKIKKSKEEISLLNKWCSIKKNIKDHFLWERILCFVEENYSMETQELIVSILLEIHGEIIDELENIMNTSEDLKLNPSMNLKQLKGIIELYFEWALKIDYEDPEKQRRFWYYSEEKLEPRFGDRFNDPGAEKEMPLAIGRDISRLYKKICDLKENISVGIFLQSHAEYRGTIKRVQTLKNYPYAEIRDNLIDSEVCPIDLLRFKLAFFGASKFDPKSDLWTRITLFQGAPLPNNFANDESDEWPFPTSPS
tara:strand:+ start:672 stop:2372 length:1701 start_codon:yes stop_codon:yes gene_type:complete